jgi:hypothetical protein
VQPEQVVEIDYTNWRGKRSIRQIVPRRLVWENNEWHPETQWLIHALDFAKGVERTFAVKSIHSWKPFVEKPKDENQWLLHCRHGQSCFRHGQCMYGCKLKDNPKLKEWMQQEAAETMKSVI